MTFTPAACDTLKRYFAATGTKPSDYDRIYTGDLGAEGHAIVIELMRADGYDMTGNYDDCGLLIFDRERQDMQAGGSGCGCSASVLAAEILPALRIGRLQNVLFLATGALMSPASVEQGSGIPGIAHLVHFMGGNP